MKTFFVILFFIGVFVIYQGNFLFHSSYNSAETGVSFDFPNKMVVTGDNNGKITISYPKPSENQTQIQVHKILLSKPELPLTFSISREFLRSTTGEQSANWGRPGLTFQWESEKSFEKAFAFQKDTYLYVITTFNADKNGSIYKDLQEITSSMVVR